MCGSVGLLENLNGSMEEKCAYSFYEIIKLNAYFNGNVCSWRVSILTLFSSLVSATGQTFLKNMASTHLQKVNQEFAAFPGIDFSAVLVCPLLVVEQSSKANSTGKNWIIVEKLLLFLSLS